MRLLSFLFLFLFFSVNLSASYNQSHINNQYYPNVPCGSEWQYITGVPWGEMQLAGGGQSYLWNMVDSVKVSPTSSLCNVTVDEVWFTIGDCTYPEVPNADDICSEPTCDETDPNADCDGDGEPNGTDPDGDPDGDGIPNDTDTDDDNDGVPDINDSDNPDYDPSDPQSDPDADGIPNETDTDDDNDGTSDSLDPDHPDFNKQTSDCLGSSGSGAYYPEFPVFPLTEYSYTSSYQTIPTCQSAVTNSNIDSVYIEPDKNPNCERDYCYVHKLDCDFSAKDYQPNGYIYYSSAKSDIACNSKVDGVKYSDNLFKVPSTFCDVGFCYLLPVVPPEDGSDEEVEPENEVDLNSTSQDNQAIVEALNKSNQHLDNINDKIDKTNDRLDKSNEIANDILTSTQDISNNLSELSKKSDTLISNSELMNDSLSNINKAINTSNDNTKSLNTAIANTNSKIDTLNSNQMETTQAINDGLFSDTNPFSDIDLTDDGSSTFDDLSTQATSSLNLTEDTNIFGLKTLGTNPIGTYSFNMLGQNFVIFEPSMLNDFPIEEIRALFMFFFAIAGFITVFRTV